MSKREAAIMIVTAAVGLVGANMYLTPNRHHNIKASMDSELHHFNNVRRKTAEDLTGMRPEQDPMDTIFDRTALMEKVKEDKPWNKTYAEKERTARH